MIRALIFTGLFPPLALFVFIGPAAVERLQFPSIRTLCDMLRFAYMFALAPGWLTAIVDGTLSAMPRYLRLILTKAAAVLFALLTAWFLGFDMPTTSDRVTVGLMGAVPAAICSWLSSISQERLA